MWSVLLRNVLRGLLLPRSKVAKGKEKQEVYLPLIIVRVEKIQILVGAEETAGRIKVELQVLNSRCCGKIHFRFHKPAKTSSPVKIPGFDFNFF